MNAFRASFIHFLPNFLLLASGLLPASYATMTMPMSPLLADWPAESACPCAEEHSPARPAGTPHGASPPCADEISPTLSARPAALGPCPCAEEYSPAGQSRRTLASTTRVVALALCPCAEEYSPAGQSRRMMASTISARAPFITLESGTTNPARRREDIQDRRPLAVILPVKCWITALRLCGHRAWSCKASTRSFLRVTEAGMPHKLRQPLKSCTRVAAINSPNKDMAEVQERKARPD